VAGHDSITERSAARDYFAGEPVAAAEAAGLAAPLSPPLAVLTSDFVSGFAAGGADLPPEPLLFEA